MAIVTVVATMPTSHGSNGRSPRYFGPNARWQCQPSAIEYPTDDSSSTIVSIHAPNRDDSNFTRATSPSQQSTYDATRMITVPRSAIECEACAVIQQPIATRIATTYEIWFGVIGVHTSNRVSGNDTGR